VTPFQFINISLVDVKTFTPHRLKTLNFTLVTKRGVFLGVKISLKPSPLGVNTLGNSKNGQLSTQTILLNLLSFLLDEVSVAVTA